MIRKIKVDGKAQMSVAPDRVSIILNLKEMKETHEEAVKAAVDAVDEIQAGFTKLGFQKEDIHTSSFEVTARYKDVYIENHDNPFRERKEQKLIGYEYTQRVMIELAIDNELLGKSLYFLGRCKSNPKIKLQYSISDTDSVARELLKQMAVDAKKKAVILVEALGHKLGEAMLVDYSYSNFSFHSDTTYDLSADAGTGNIDLSCRSTMMMFKNKSFDLYPENIVIKESAEFVWEIK